MSRPWAPPNTVAPLKSAEGSAELNKAANRFEMRAASSSKERGGGGGAVSSAEAPSPGRDGPAFLRTRTERRACGPGPRRPRVTCGRRDPGVSRDPGPGFSRDGAGRGGASLAAAEASRGAGPAGEAAARGRAPGRPVLGVRPVPPRRLRGAGLAAQGREGQGRDFGWPPPAAPGELWRPRLGAPPPCRRLRFPLPRPRPGGGPSAPRLGRDPEALRRPRGRGAASQTQVVEPVVCRFSPTFHSFTQH